MLNELTKNCNVYLVTGYTDMRKGIDGLATVKPLSGSGLSKAIQYVLNEKQYLYAFLKNSDIPIENNLAERTVKPFVIGIKNWLFSTSVKGANASAVIYSVINTAMTNGFEPKEYMTELFNSNGKIPLPLK